MTRVPPAVVRRLVLLSGLTACVLTVYATAKVAWMERGAGRPGGVTWLAATGLVALAVSLARPQFERLADRLAYGPDGDPYAVIAKFVQRISDALAVDDVLPHLARTASQAVHSPGSEVRLWLADGAEWRQTWPPGREQVDGPVSVPLQHHGHPVGRLAVEVPPDALSATDRELLNRLSGPAGLALSNVRLTYELRRRLEQASGLAEQLRLSRQRLIDARGEQRRRFATSVTERVGTHLVRADAALVAAGEGDPGALPTSRVEVLAALEALRELAAGVFPPVLEERGPGPALERFLEAVPHGVALYAGGLADTRFALNVEAAAYFCCVALVEDVGRHGPVTVTLNAAGPALEVAVSAAVGPSDETERLARDRVEALGGSLDVRLEPGGRANVAARLPVEAVMAPGRGQP